PIVRSTAAGLRSIDPAVIDAGVAMGMTRRQLLWLVELPLALPSIVSGIRIATIVGIGTATIAAAIGAGGLGEYIFRGLSMVDSTVILAGAIPAALLALIADGVLTWVERRLSPGRQRPSRPAPLGFNNTFAIVVRRADADALGLKTIDDLRRLDAQWRPGFGYEFAERTDGYAGLASAYELHFAAPPRVMDLDLVYRALASKQVDVIAGDATSGLIKA